MEILDLGEVLLSDSSIIDDGGLCWRVDIDDSVSGVTKRALDVESRADDTALFEIVVLSDVLSVARALGSWVRIDVVADHEV